MKRRLGVAGLLLAVACVPVSAADLAIVGVTVVDVTDGSLHADQTVLVQGDHIARMGPAERLEVPDRADIVDGTSRYLVPGLWDAHVHSAASVKWHFPLYLAHGITSVRNLHSGAEDPLALVNSIKRQLVSGELRGPRFLANGGADFIKVYDYLNRDSYFAVLDEAKRRGISVDGHVPIPVTPEEAAAAGQRTIEHTSGIGMGCSSEADAIRADFLRFVEQRPDMPRYPDAAVAYFKLVRRSIDTRDPELCMETVRTYRTYGVSAVPTLVVAGSQAQAFVRDASRMGLLPPSVREQWRAMAGAGGDPIEALIGPVYDSIADNVRLLDEGQVVVLAGTDVGNPFLVPGLSLHRELVKLHEAGLSALRALQAATILPARVFGLADSIGTVETGKLADLVVLDANPLEDISSTQRIRAVVVNGRLLRRADLDDLLAEVESMEL